MDTSEKLVIQTTMTTRNTCARELLVTGPLTLDSRDTILLSLLDADIF